MPAPPTETAPSGAEIAAEYDRLLDLAGELLPRPVSTRVKAWEDGEYEVRVWHKLPSAGIEGHHRAMLRSHSAESGVTGAVGWHGPDGDIEVVFQTDVTETGTRDEFREQYQQRASVARPGP